MRHRDGSVLCWPTFNSSMVKLPPRSMTMSITCGSIIESMMWPLRTSRAVCFRSWRGPREVTAQPQTSWGFRSRAHSGDDVDLVLQRFRLAARLRREQDAAARRYQARGRVAVPRGAHRSLDVAALRADAGKQERQVGPATHLADLRRRGRPDDQADVAMPVQSLGQLDDVAVDGLAPGVEVLQVDGARVGRAAQHVDTAVVVAGELLHRIRAQVRVDGRRVHAERAEDGARVGAHRVVHVAAFGVEQERRPKSLLAQLEQGLPAVRSVLLPEGAVGLEAAHVLFRLAYHLAAVPQRPGRAAADTVGVGVEADAEQCLAFARERSQPFEVGQASKW